MARNNRREVKETVFDDKWGSSYGLGCAEETTFKRGSFHRAHANNFRRGSFRTTQASKGYFDAMVTLFIGNLPEEMDSEWMSQIFRSAGEVIDAFIPLKRSYLHNDRFGFIRFANKEEGFRAIEMMDGMEIRNHKLLVKFARFQNSERHKIFKKMSPRSSTQVWKPKPSKTQGKPMNSCRTIKPIKVAEVGNEWLTRSAIAKLYPDRSLVFIQDHLKMLGHVNIQAIPMGGDKIVLTFNSIEDRDSVFTGGEFSWLNDWFAEILKWECAKVSPSTRLIWLNCYGIPLHLWNAGTFKKLGMVWGEVIQIADDTIKGLNFSVGKVLISTDVMDVINQSVEVECKGVLYPIRVIEEQMVMNTVLKISCSCLGCQSAESSFHGNQMANYAATISDSECVPVSNANGMKGIVECADESPDTLNEGTVNALNLVDNTAVGCTSGCSPLAACNINDLDKQVVTFIPNYSDESNPLSFLEAVGSGTVSFHVSNLNNLSLNYSFGFIPPLNSIPKALPFSEPLVSNPGDSISKWNAPYNADLIDSPSVTIHQLENAVDSTTVKATRRYKSVEELLKIPKSCKRDKSKKCDYSKSNKRGGRKQKCVVFRSAIAAAALSVSSISSGGIKNRNRIILDEDEAAWTVTKIIGEDYLGNDEEIISKIMITDNLEKDAGCSVQSPNLNL